MTRRIRHLALLAATLAGLIGCSLDPGDASGAITEADPSARQVSTLLASVSVSVGEDMLSAEHLVEARISVDGSHWGVFGFDSTPPDDWTLVKTSDGLLRAAIAEDLTLDEAGPKTIQGWTVFLDRALEAGDHVVRIDELILRTAGGEEIALSSSAWMPFRVELGDGTAWIGDLRFTLDALP